MRKKKQQQQNKEGGANWMDTYGDLVTLLLCFFVLLFSFSSVDAAKWEALVKSFTGASGILENENIGGSSGAVPIVTSDPVGPPLPTATPLPTPTQTPTPSPTPSLPPSPTMAPTATPIPRPTATPIPSHMKELYSDIRGLTNTTGVDISYENNEVRIRIISSVLFEPGSATLTPKANEVLTTIGKTVEKYSEKIAKLHTEGHTDNFTEVELGIESKSELAGIRASRVLEYLRTNTSIPDSKAYESVSMGSAVPVASNDTENGRDLNNRVDIIIKQ